MVESRCARLKVALEELLRLRHGVSSFTWCDRVDDRYLTVGVIPQGAKHGAHYMGSLIEGDVDRCRELVLETLLRAVASDLCTYSARAVEGGCQ